MKRVVFLLLLSITVSLQAQLLWQISGKNTKSTSYILGTHPLIPAKALDSIPGVYKAFNKCNLVISKYNAYSVEAEGSLKRAAILPMSKSMKNYLSDSAYKTIDTELKKVLKFGLKEVGLMHPAMIRQLYLTELFNIAVNLSDDAQTDSYFQMVAGIKGIEVVGLENYTNYLNALFDAAKIQAQANQLEKDVENASNYKSNFRELIHQYNNSNTQEISRLLKVMGNDITVDKVDASFSPAKVNKIAELLRTNSCFVTVDVLQLDGESGIISQLQKSGFELKPYPATKRK